MYNTPLGLTATAEGTESTAGVPSPATVVIVPSGETFRTRLLPLSAMYTLPAESTSMAGQALRIFADAGVPADMGS